MSSNNKVVKDIGKMPENELLDFIMDNSEYLSDPYYRVFGRAIEARYAELRS